MGQMLWIGSVESEEEFENKAKKGYSLAAAQISQQNLIRGIEQASGCVFDSVNGSVLPPYPVYADRVIRPVVWSHAGGAFDISVGYKNGRYVNRLYCKRAMIKAAGEWVEKRYRGGELTVMVYSMRSGPMAAACHVKKRIPHAKLYLIVTDLPQYMDLGQSRVKAALKRIDWLSIKRMQKRFAGFILYAGKMAEYLRIPQEKWMLMEGSYDVGEAIGGTPAVRKKAVMYAGTLDKQYGIPMLIEAFMEIPDRDAELWLTGGGNAEEYIRECALKDERIRFYGFLPSRAEVLKLQKQASLLVNMRLPSEPASAYCFPSKLFEYMATGVPVLSFRLGGIPEEYERYLVMVGQESRSALKRTIISAFENAELDEHGARAREFICTEKSNEKQCRRIVDWING